MLAWLQLTCSSECLLICLPGVPYKLKIGQCYVVASNILMTCIFLFIILLCNIMTMCSIPWRSQTIDPFQTAAIFPLMLCSGWMWGKCSDAVLQVAGRTNTEIIMSSLTGWAFNHSLPNITLWVHPERFTSRLEEICPRYGLIFSK